MCTGDGSGVGRDVDDTDDADRHLEYIWDPSSEPDTLPSTEDERHVSTTTDSEEQTWGFRQWKDWGLNWGSFRQETQGTGREVSK